MNRKERETIERLPHKYRPIGAWGYLGYTILFTIPVIGFICLIIFALSGGNVNRRSFARSYFAGFLIIILLAAASIAILYFAMPEMFAKLKDYVMQLYEQIMGMFNKGGGSEGSLALLKVYLGL